MSKGRDLALLDEPLRVLAADERLDCVAERGLGARALVEDHVDAHDEEPEVPTGVPTA